MKIAIDILLLIIIAYCSWNGYRRGIINGVGGILKMLVSILIACLLSGAFSGAAVTALKPFVSGYVESQSANVVVDDMGISAGGKSLADTLTEQPELAQEYCEGCFEALGFHEKRAVDLAERAVEIYEAKQTDITEAVVEVACDTISYVFGAVLAFALVIILITVITNLINVTFVLPRLKQFDELGGAAVGFLKGFLYCVFLCWLLSFCGIIIGKGTLDGTLLGRFFLLFGFITRIIV